MTSAVDKINTLATRKKAVWMKLNNVGLRKEKPSSNNVTRKEIFLAMIQNGEMISVKKSCNRNTRNNMIFLVIKI